MAEEVKNLSGPARGAAWAAPLVRFDGWLTKVESTLCAIVLVAEILALCFWIAMKGLASASGQGDLSGLLMRSVITSVVLGIAAHRFTRPKPGDTSEQAEKRYVYATTGAVLLGLLLGRAWVGVGATYFSNLLNWYQNASLLMLFGGLSGLATRLTLWVALLGASIATAKGKHINVDVVMRFLSDRLRVAVAIVGWMTGALVCTAAAWGFVDFIAVASFKLPTAIQCPDNPDATCPMPATRELGMLGEEVSRDLFLARRQIALDFKVGPRVLFGADYNQILTNGEWNTWLREGHWEEHFPAEDVERLYAQEERAAEFHTPAVNVPGGSEGVRGLLIRDFDFIFPFGLLMIALRFVLRSLLALSGHVKVDPDALHEEEDLPSQAEDDAKAALLAKGGAA